MKKVYLVLFAAIFSIEGAKAQSAFGTYETIDINRISARSMVHGNMWYDPIARTPQCEFPKGSGKYIGNASALWMGGMDLNGNFLAAVQTWGLLACDFWPGPLDSTGIISYSKSQDWAKIWKVNRTDIQAFQAMTTHTTSNTPLPILTWPASGNIFAAGNAGAALTISAGTAMAPFIDLNSNGIYEPLLGEYPDIKGDQALWYVFNDACVLMHPAAQTLPLHVEVHVMAFAYNRNTLIDNVVYYEYEVFNRSHKSYVGFRLGQFADMDLGYKADDFIGYDSVHRMAIQYSGTPMDGSSVGFPSNSYGAQAPVVGLSMVSLPGDAGSTYVPAGSFTYFNIDTGKIGNPTNGFDCYNYMRSLLKNTSHFTNDFAGKGHPTKGYGAGPDVNYVYPGDPSDTGNWSECSSGNTPGDRMFVISTNDITFSPGQKIKVAMALVTTDTNQGGCPAVNFHDVKQVADTAWYYYYNPLPKLAVENNTVNNKNIVSVYPNPATNQLTIKTEQNAYTSFTITNSMGQILLQQPINSAQTNVDIKFLASGLYYISLKGAEGILARKFVKVD